MHVVVYLPSAFYSAIASTVVETLQAVNEVRRSPAFSLEFVAKVPCPVSKSGISFPARTRPSKKMDMLIVLAGMGAELSETLRLLDEQSKYTTPLIRLAQKQGAIIASTCGAAYLLAAAGLLDGKRSTISWWLKKEASRRFPQVRWEPSRMIVRQGPSLHFWSWLLRSRTDYNFVDRFGLHQRGTSGSQVDGSASISPISEPV
jgi:transcriptional regulator GlxA family with amidase domain